MGAARMTAATVAPHAFVDSGRRRVDTVGRSLRVCAVCDRTLIGRGHRRPDAATDRQPEQARVAPPDAAPEAEDRSPRQVAEPWQVSMLRLALDQVLALPADSVGWRLRMRAADLAVALHVGTFAEDGPIDPQLDPLRPEYVDVDERDSHGAEPSREVRPSKRHGAKWLRSRFAACGMWPIIERALDHGWTARREGGGMRVVLLSPNGVDSFRMHASGEPRSYENARAAARRAGLDTAGL